MPRMWTSTRSFSHRTIASTDDEPVDEPLTNREVQVLELLAEGLSNKGIATRLAISDQTVKFHVASISGKLGAANRTDAVRRPCGAALSLSRQASPGLFSIAALPGRSSTGVELSRAGRPSAWRRAIRSSVSCRCRSSMPATGAPANAMITSPSRRPAVAAGLRASIDVTRMPDATAICVHPRDRARHRYVLPGDADVAAADPAVANQLRGDEPRGVARDREGQAPAPAESSRC